MNNRIDVVLWIILLYSTIQGIALMYFLGMEVDSKYTFLFWILASGFIILHVSVYRMRQYFVLLDLAGYSISTTRSRLWFKIPLVYTTLCALGLISQQMCNNLAVQRENLLLDIFTNLIFGVSFGIVSVLLFVISHSLWKELGDLKNRQSYIAKWIQKSLPA